MKRLSAWALSLLLAVAPASAQMMATGIGGGGFGGAAAGCSDTDATAWQSAVVTAGGTVSGTQYGYVCTLITNLKSHSLWAKADRIWLYASENATQASIDLKGLVAHTLVGTPTFTASQGYTGNGTDYINTNFVPPTNGVAYTINSASVAAYIRNNRTADANISEIGTSTAGGVQTALQPNTFGNGNNMSVNDGNGTSFGTSVGTSQGFWTATRTGANARALYRNGSVLGSDASGTGSLTGMPAVFVLAFNNNGTAIQKASDQLAIVWIGGALDATDNANLSTDINAYMTALGTNVY